MADERKRLAPWLVPTEAQQQLEQQSELRYE